MHRPRIDRRSFLKSTAALSGVAAGAGLLPVLSPTAAASWSPRPGFGRADRKTKHVVLIAFAGGVRTRETLGTPGNVPTLAAMADEGVTYPRSRTANLGHFGAALSLFTGISEARGIRENARGPDPTVFEYVRKDLGLPPGEVWISTSGGAQQTNYSHGMHADYGPPFGANTLDGDGIFNTEFKEILAAWGRPREMGDAEQAALDRMRRAVGAESGEPGASSVETAAEVENYILGELTRGTADIRGANAADAKAIRVARNLLTIFRPGGPHPDHPVQPPDPPPRPGPRHADAVGHRATAARRAVLPGGVGRGRPAGDIAGGGGVKRGRARAHASSDGSVGRRNPPERDGRCIRPAGRRRCWAAFKAALRRFGLD